MYIVYIHILYQYIVRYRICDIEYDAMFRNIMTNISCIRRQSANLPISACPGCVYGKGNQYTGRANITLSGNTCLSWDDERIIYQLRMHVSSLFYALKKKYAVRRLKMHCSLSQVVSKEIRDKLRTHNFCRNPNPGKESRPWCFAEPLGKREYCDIPACGNVGMYSKLINRISPVYADRREVP